MSDSSAQALQRLRMWFGALLLASGCATLSSTPSVASPSAQTRCDPARDRAAILQMAGTFRVRFAFDETEALSPDYEPHAPYRTDATEVVSVLTDTPERVVLQHVLMLQKHSGAWEPLKHWRQDWTYQDRELWEYRGQRTWERRELSEAQVSCSWSQAVFEVDDGPRYESYGRFEHQAPRAIWTSQSTWRPLPRREYTQRSDYDVLVGENRHEITPSGWLHLQDNEKLVLSGDRRLVRERGRNEYTRVQLPEAELAKQYLTRTASFWETVRAEWAQAMSQNTRLTILQEQAGKPMHDHLFPLAERSATADEQRVQIRAVLSSYVVTPQSQAAVSSLAPRAQ